MMSDLTIAESSFSHLINAPRLSHKPGAARRDGGNLQWPSRFSRPHDDRVRRGGQARDRRWRSPHRRTFVRQPPPIERVDIPDWLFHLASAEYQRRCPPEHIAAGASTTDDGQPMSINVEMIGTTSWSNSFVGGVTDRDHCRMVDLGRVHPARAHHIAGGVGPQPPAHRRSQLRIHQSRHRDRHRRVLALIDEHNLGSTGRRKHRVYSGNSRRSRFLLLII
jgi:hypothetical protein